MRFHERDYMCASVYMTRICYERAITGILFRTKVIVIERTNILSGIYLIARYIRSKGINHCDDFMLQNQPYRDKCSFLY